MKPIFIGITGGTGAGKSTIANSLQDKYPNKIGLVQLDDYFKPSTEVTEFKGYRNWDHPNMLDFDKIVKDLSELSQGKSVMIETKNEKLNPEYKKTRKKVSVELSPKPIILVEGHFVLFDERIRGFLDTSIWLDVDYEKRWERRVHFKYPEYKEKVLKPMHDKFVEPTKKYADHIIKASALTESQIEREVEDIISLCSR